MKFKKNRKSSKNKDKRGLIAILIAGGILYYLGSGYVFFWAWYIFLTLFFVVFSAGIFAFIYFALKEKLNDDKGKKRKKKPRNKVSLSKKIGNIGLVTLSSAISLVLYFFIAKELLLMTLDIPNVVKGEYMKSYCEVEKVRTGSTKNRQVQYVTVRDFNTNEIIEVKFQHRYKTIYYKLNYNITYLPHSKLGVEAEFAK
ncbi:hypothetical protein [Clostridium sp. UBA4548]|uniref:hypothetical protein n=1 Tax=Clostridium sp. UBA4548 TaxID=1946361 RepID=UPI0025C08810|nr:hypothetical protein [Clostridium sp. UBA4548]